MYKIDIQYGAREIISKGKLVGEVLTHLLNMVINEKIQKDNFKLMSEDRRFIDSR